MFPPARMLAACIVILVFFAEPVHSQTPPDPEDAFSIRLEQAYSTDDRGQIDNLIKENRLKVKPAVQRLVSESLTASISGDPRSAEGKLSLAREIAAAFERHFGEKSLTEAVSYVPSWSLEQKRQKLLADSLSELGTTLRGSKESRADALAHYRDALRIYRSLGDRLGEATTLGGVGVVYWYLSEADSVLAYFEKALEVRRAVDDRQLIANSYNDIGLLHHNFTRDHSEALKHYLLAASIREEIGDLERLRKTYNTIASTYRQLGELGSALTYVERAVEANERLGDETQIALELYNAGMVLTDLGRYNEALQHLARAADIAERRGETKTSIQVLNWTGAVYRRMGDFESALESYHKALINAEEAGNVALMTDALINIGVVLEYAGREEQARGYYEKALDRTRSNDDKSRELRALANLSNILLLIGEDSLAAARAGEALELSRQLNDTASESRALTALANAQTRQRKWDQAYANYQLGLEIADVLNSPDLTWPVLVSLADHHQSRGAYQKAITRYREALDLIEGVRGRLFSESDKAGYLAQKRFAYEEIIHVLTRLHTEDPHSGYDLEAFELAERAKARALSDLLAEAVANIRENVDPQLLEREETLLAEIAQAQQDLQREAAGGERDEASIAEHRKRLEELESDYQNLQREIRSTHPDYSALQSPPSVSISELQQKLTVPGTVVLEYAVGDSSSSLWVIKHGARRLYRLPDRETLQEQIDVLRFGLSRPDQSDPTAFTSAARSLYKLLIEPADSMIAEGEHVVVIPDGPLYYIPFEVLLTGDSDDDDSSYGALPYFIRENALSYGQSAGVLLQLRKDRFGRDEEAPKQLLALGDPIFRGSDDAPYEGGDSTRAGLERLPYSGEEVRAISSLFSPDQVDLLLQEAASEANIKANADLRKYRFIHFATHGLIDERRPDFSSIALTQDDDLVEDGFLHAAEIFTLQMNPELVVLSACETGLGKMVRGEGMIGLTRAFMYAGAPSVVVSLWQVADRSTSTLMQEFYAELVGTPKAKSEALRIAKTRMLEEERFAHPFHWAPFVIVGDWD